MQKDAPMTEVVNRASRSSFLNDPSLMLLERWGRSENLFCKLHRIIQKVHSPSRSRDTGRSHLQFIFFMSVYAPYRTSPSWFSMKNSPRKMYSVDCQFSNTWASIKKPCWKKSDTSLTVLTAILYPYPVQ